MPAVKSLFTTTGEGRCEVFVPLLKGGSFRLEQIASFGAGSDPGFWYDQSEPEWVVLMRGTAVLEFEDGPMDLVGGDALLIPAGTKHRVVQTSIDAVWLALHFEPVSLSAKEGR